MQEQGIKDNNLFFSGRKQYFKGAKSDIARQNLKILRNSSIAVAVLVTFFILVTPAIIKGWAATAEYYIFAVVSYIFVAFSISASIRKLSNEKLIQTVSMFFNICIMSGMIVIDTIPYPDKIATFTPMFLAVSPTLFILPFAFSHPFLLVSTAAFCVSAYLNNSAGIFELNAFHGFVGLMFGFALSFIVMGIRVGEFEARKKYHSLSQIDGLTRLLNKSASQSSIRNYMVTKHNSQRCVAMLIELQDFTEINEILGRDIGDNILFNIGSLLSHIGKSEDIIGRFGGDRFIILFKNLSDSLIIEQKAEKIIKTINSVPTGRKNITINCNVGVCITNGTYVTWEDLIAHSEQALVNSKMMGKNNYAIYSETDITANEKYILIVDDMSINRAILAMAFKRDYSIIEASDGKEAIETLNLEADKIAVVLLDLVMHEVNGYEVIKYMKNKKSTKDIPILVITSDIENEERALREGADDVIHKPVQPEIARLRVDKLVKRKTR